MMATSLTKSSTTPEELKNTENFILNRITEMNKVYPYGRKSYDLERGEKCEDIVVELLQSLGIDAGRYRQTFPKNAGHLIRACQVDIWVRGGVSGKIYQLETKTRGSRSESIFDYNPIAVGGCQTWDEKNAAIASKPGRKVVLGMVVVCQNTGMARVTNCLPERQMDWKRVSFDYELSYAVEHGQFIDIVAFARYLKTI